MPVSNPTSIKIKKTPLKFSVLFSHMVKHSSSVTGPIYQSGCHKISTLNITYIVYIIYVQKINSSIHSNFVKSLLPLSPVAPLYIVYHSKYRLYNPIKVLFRKFRIRIEWLSQQFLIKPRLKFTWCILMCIFRRNSFLFRYFNFLPYHFGKITSIFLLYST